HYVQVSAYSGAARWATSELKSFKFRILKTAEEFAQAEKNAQEAKKEEKALLDKQVGESPAAKPTDEVKAPEAKSEAKSKDAPEQKKEVKEEKKVEKSDKTDEKDEEAEESESGE
ncbi:hypothetical protein J7M28_11325, partial [bacterium]|nr:hypothetical protein [bacterium]